MVRTIALALHWGNVVARENFILVRTYSVNGTEPELVLYKRR